MRAVLIAEPRVDFDNFLIGAHEATGEQLAREADTVRNIGDTKKWAMCLQALAGTSALAHVSLTFMVALHYEQTPAFISSVGDIAVIVRETNSELNFLIATGSVEQWIAACRDNDGQHWSDIRHEIRKIVNDRRAIT